ncbi:MAG: DUF4382 domain-containing protein [Cyclobacteriaceae bacterium]
MKKILGLLTIATLAWACGDGNETATVRVALVDAPGDYEQVNIDVQDVLINTGSDTTDEGGWESIGNFEAGVYDVLKLTNGEEALLGEIELPEGQLGQVRVLLGDANTLMIDGQEVDLKVPSGSQSGVKLNIGASIEAGITYKLVLDFDASKSIVEAGNSGKYNMKPVIRASMEATTGAISGVVNAADFGAVVYAIQGTDSISTYPADNGEFLVRALDAGFYDVVAVPTIDTVAAMSVEAVEVVVGEVSDAGTFQFD